MIGQEESVVAIKLSDKRASLHSLFYLRRCTYFLLKNVRFLATLTEKIGVKLPNDCDLKSVSRNF